MKYFVWISACMFSISCTNKKEIDFGLLKQRYSSTYLDYFSEVGFYKDKLFKWDKDITVSLNGSYSVNDLTSINEFIEIFNTEVQSIKMTINSNQKADIFVSFCDSPYLKGNLGMTYNKSQFLSFNGKLLRSKIYISPKSTNRNLTIQHELLHAVGLQHSNKKFNFENMLGIRVFSDYDEIDKYYEEKSKLNILPIHDRIALKIMYSELPKGLRKQTFIKGIGD